MIYIRAYVDKAADTAVVQFRRYGNGRLLKERRVTVTQERAWDYGRKLKRRGWRKTESLCKAGMWGARRLKPPPPLRTAYTNIRPH